MNYLEKLAREIEEEVDPGLLPEGDTGLLFLIYAVLLQAKGGSVERKDVHDAWTAWMTAAGREHAALIPYADLPADTQRQDQPYVDAIRAVASRRK